MSFFVSLICIKLVLVFIFNIVLQSLIQKDVQAETCGKGKSIRETGEGVCCVCGIFSLLSMMWGEGASSWGFFVVKSLFLARISYSGDDGGCNLTFRDSVLFIINKCKII